MNPPAADPWLFVCRKPPYGNPYASACLELLLTAAVFERETALLFMEDGVLQLLPGQEGAAIGLKDQARSLPALELYEVRKVYAEAAALERHGLGLQDLVLPVEALSQDQMRGLLGGPGQVFLF